MTQPGPADSPFVQAFRGGFTAALRWPQLDALWERVRDKAGAGWYLYAVGEPPPEAPADAEAVRHFIEELDALLRAEHQEDYCGIVYADDPHDPTFIKVYDPNNLGMVCGSSGGPPPLPGWILSLLPPEDISRGLPLPGGRWRWWRRILGH